MLDIRFVRENPDAVKENIKKKFPEQKLPLVDKVIDLDTKNRAVMTEANALRAERNTLSKQVGMLMGQAKKDPSKLAQAEAAQATVTAQAQRLAELEAEEEKLEGEIRDIMLVIPNMIDPSVPIGPDDSPLCRSLTFPTTPRSWRASAASIWTAPAVWPATASTTCWATSPACTRRCWPTPATL